MTRVCMDCKVEKPLSDYHKHQASRGGRRVVCKTCLKVRRPYDASERNRARRYRKTTQGRWVVWGKNLRGMYGIDQEDWARMFNAQGCKCAICKQQLNVNSAERDLHLDHDHSSGKVRGILCKKCNSLLGMCLEDENVLQRAIEYLRRYT